MAVKRGVMQELKTIGICRQCDHFKRMMTYSGHELFKCTLEFEDFHKLSTVLYNLPVGECPYYMEHFVASLRGAGILKEYHERLGYKSGKGADVH